MALVLLVGSGSVFMASCGQTVQQRLDDRHVSSCGEQRRTREELCSESTVPFSVSDPPGGSRPDRSPGHTWAVGDPARFPFKGGRRAGRSALACQASRAKPGRGPARYHACVRGKSVAPSKFSQWRRGPPHVHVEANCNGHQQCGGGAGPEDISAKGKNSCDEVVVVSAYEEATANRAGGWESGGGSCASSPGNNLEGDNYPGRDGAWTGHVARKVATWALAAALVFSDMSGGGWPALAVGLGVAGIPTAPTAIIDAAGSIPPAKRATLSAELAQFESETGWKLRVLTRYRQGDPPSNEDVLKFWKPDERTILVIEDVTSPNILNFNAGSLVLTKLPRQFFIELQSRFGNLFYVREEGEQRAVLQAIDAIQDCLRREKGCRFVPGLTDDLYFLTLATSVVGGAVFGFAARIPPSGNINYPWQWILIFSPLWGILLGSFGIGPIVSRTAELEPLIKNLVAFSATALAMYLTPIFGTPPAFSGDDEGKSGRDQSQ